MDGVKSRLVLILLRCAENSIRKDAVVLKCAGIIITLVIETEINNTTQRKEEEHMVMIE